MTTTTTPAAYLTHLTTECPVWAAEDKLVGYGEQLTCSDCPEFIAAQAEKPKPNKAAEALAEMLLESDDFYEAFDALRPFLAAELYTETCHRLELCPEHFTDVQSCQDDELACQYPWLHETN